jgi:ATP synthase protein I
MSDPPAEDPFVKEVRRQAERARLSRDLTFWQGMRLVGAVGWMVSLPAVAGAFLGRSIDGHYASGVFWTLSFLVLGLVLGCASAWRHVQRSFRE